MSDMDIRPSIDEKVRTEGAPAEPSVETYPETTTVNKWKPSKIKKKDAHRTLMGWLGILLIGSIIWVDTGRPATDVITSMQASGIANGAKVGEILFQSDSETMLQPRDFTVNLSHGSGTARMLLWDFSAEDGDVVMVKVDGIPQGNPITLKNKPVSISVPIPSTVQIVGVRDGINGISYALKLPGTQLDSVFYNLVAVGSENSYIIKIP